MSRPETFGMTLVYDEHMAKQKITHFLPYGNLCSHCIHSSHYCTANVWN